MGRIQAFSELAVIAIYFWTVTLIRSLILNVIIEFKLIGSIDASGVFQEVAIAILASLKLFGERLRFMIGSLVISVIVRF